MSILNRLNRELETFGRKAQAALDEGKLQLELVRLRRQRDTTARELGLLVHRRERTGEAEPRRIEALMARIDHLEAEIARVQREVAAEKGETVTVDAAPMPTRGEDGQPGPGPAGPTA
ncbi:MAG TPA: hypothetical protein VFS40_12195 [Gemmatimonadales bacterium]|nr:hypothetical protein [Gemmatimonadales bacterium]